MDADTREKPINGYFSSIKRLSVKSTRRKKVYEATDTHKVIVTKNVLDFSNDYTRCMDNTQFWYLDSDDTGVTATAATNKATRASARFA